MSAGFIYVLSNPSMPGIVKIGRTTRHPSERASELYKTASGVPSEFHVESAVWSPLCEDSEANVHSSLRGYRVNASREFFRISVDRAVTEVINCAVGFSHFVCAVEADKYVCEAFIAQMADSIGASSRDVCEAIHSMTQEDVEALLERVAEDRSARIAASKAKAEKGHHEP